MFTFLGAFGSPPDGLVAEFERLWPDSDFARLSTPFEAIAVRLTNKTDPSDEGDLPHEIAEALVSLSGRLPKSRILFVRADCWGGICSFAGQVIQRGGIVVEIRGPQSLRRLIQHFGVDIGEREIFEPFTRQFLWLPFSGPAPT